MLIDQTMEILDLTPRGLIGVTSPEGSFALGGHADLAV